MKKVLEVCVDSAESAVRAAAGGATRLELCANLVIGGTSPDEDLFRMVRERVDIPVRVLLRPRCGDFLYTDDEFELLRRQVRRFAARGADGVVIGVLRPDGTLDEPRMAELIALAGRLRRDAAPRVRCVPRPVCGACEAARRLGVDTILTAGQQAQLRGRGGAAARAGRAERGTRRRSWWARGWTRLCNPCAWQPLTGADAPSTCPPSGWRTAGCSIPARGRADGAARPERVCGLAVRRGRRCARRGRALDAVLRRTGKEEQRA